MTKFLALAAAAGLMAGTAYAQTQNEVWWVEEGGQGAIVYNQENQGSGGIPLLEEDNFASPAECPEGSYFRSGEGNVTACGEGGAIFDLASPDEGSMMPSGDPWPENTMLMAPQGMEESGEQKQ